MIDPSECLSQFDSSGAPDFLVSPDDPRHSSSQDRLEVAKASMEMSLTIAQLGSNWEKFIDDPQGWANSLQADIKKIEKDQQIVIGKIQKIFCLKD